MTEPLSRRQFLYRSGAGAGALAAGYSSEAASTGRASRPSEAPSPPAGSGRRPNILFIMTDQQRHDCFGAGGNRIIRTPALDRLAADGANFFHAVVQSPVCVPSRACFFTGRYAHSHRNRVNYTELDTREVLLPARLQAAGYRTALIGKTHLYYRYPPTPEEAGRTGFDVVELHDGVPFTDQWSDYAKWRDEHDPMRDIHYRRLAESVPRLRKDLPAGANPYRAAVAGEFTDTTWTGLRTRHWLKQLAAERKSDGGGKPFFLFSSFFKPHSPYEIAQPFDAMYNDIEIPLPRPYCLEEIRRLPAPLVSLILRGKKPPYDMDRDQLEWIYRSYYGAISHIDREVGLILDTLRETGQADNTIVVFTSDHGDQLLEHGLLGKNVFFEASIRVPLVIAWPGRIRPGRHDELVESVDVLPTLMELADLDEPYSCQGQSLAPLVADGFEKRPYEARDAVFCENVIPEVITHGSLDFHFEKEKGVKGIRHPDAKMVRTRKWKYNYYPEGFAELYDLENDPNEDHNLADDVRRKPAADELKDRILHWLVTADEADQIAPRWLIP